MVLSIAGFLVIVLVVLAFWVRRLRRAAPGPMLFRRQENPILSPSKEEPWENAAVFNPAAILAGGTVHLFYRALGGDGISRIGYARSEDGIHFERFPEPAFVMRAPASPRFKNPFADSILHYNPGLYASGGGWGGSEDPRAVLIDGIVYLLFGVFESWESMRVALTSLHSLMSRSARGDGRNTFSYRRRERRIRTGSCSRKRYTANLRYSTRSRRRSWWIMSTHRKSGASDQ